ncbi:MAG: peptidylprolyl isomerase [Oscillospiraceae bacterium]
MKTKRLLTVAAAAVVALSMAGCSFTTGTKYFESCIVSVDLDDDDIIAAPKGAGIQNADQLAVNYLDFKKEYLYYLKSVADSYNGEGRFNDMLTEYQKSAADRRSTIISYLVSERIINDKARQLGLDVLTQEELDALNEEYEKNLNNQYKYFGEAADYGDSVDPSTISDEQKLERGKQEFDKYLADCLLTKEDLLMWQRNELISQKVEEYITKDVVIERSEAEDVLNKYIEDVKKQYAEDPVTYETGGTGTSFWLPENSRNIKHILIAFEEIDSDEIMAMRKNGDEEGANALREEKLAEIKEKADEILNMLDNGADFDELISEYSADAAGSEAFPNGYTVIPNSVSYVKDFVDAAYSLENIGDYVLAATDYGWHIVMYASDASIPQENLDMFIGYILETLTEKAKTAKYEETIAQWEAEYAFEIDYAAIAVTAPEQTGTAADAS